MSKIGHIPMAPRTPRKEMMAVIMPEIRINTAPEAICEPVRTVRSF